MKDLDLFHHSGLRLLNAQTRSIDKLIYAIAPSLDEAVEVQPEDLVVVWLLQAMGVSLHSVVKLTSNRDMGIRDCFGIARSVAEVAVNAAFISVGGSPIAQRAIRHMRQKRWRDLRRKGRISDLDISIELKLEITENDIPGLNEDLSEFTDKKGREVRDWTTESIEKRIDLVSKKYNDAARSLASGIFTIYRPSSELLHGTYYGVHYFWQGSQSSSVRNKVDFDEIWVEEHFATVLSSLIFSTVGAIQSVAYSRGLSGDHLDKQMDILKTLDKMVELLKENTENLE